MTKIQLSAVIFLDIPGKQATDCVVDVIENDDYSSRLRSLRLILGQNFRPISTVALASLTSIPLVSIRATEANRRALSADDLDAIDLLLGACWSSELHQWICSEFPTKFFTREEFLYYVNHRRPGRIATIKDKARSEEINILVSNLDDKEAALARCRIHREVCQIAVHNNLPQKVLESLQDRSPILQSKPSHLPAKDKAEIVQALADEEDSPKSVSGPKRRQRAR